MRKSALTKKAGASDEIPTITAAGLKRMLDRGEAVTPLDVRQPEGYSEYPGSIPGAVRIPPGKIPGRYRELPRGNLIVPHCT